MQLDQVREELKVTLTFSQIETTGDLDSGKANYVMMWKSALKDKARMETVVFAGGVG